jgi:DNA modification methylase
VAAAQVIIQGDARHLPLADACVDCVVTSPPYFGLRNYGHAGQIGLEPTPAGYVNELVGVFAEVRRVIKDSGTVWVNMGDSYKHKDLLGIPWMVAFALQAEGWYLRSDIIWSKPNPMPENVTDRPTKAHEYLFLLSKSETYRYDAAAIAEPASDAMFAQVEQGYHGEGTKNYEAAGVQNPSSVKARIIGNARKRADRFGGNKHDGSTSQHSDGSVYTGKLTRNRRTVWTVNTMPYAGAHFATMPEKLVEPCILAGCPLGGLVLDPFVGSGTVVAVAQRLGRRGVGVDLSYQGLSRERTAQRGIPFTADHEEKSDGQARV